MPYHCVAYGCGKTSEDGVTLYKFPKDPEEFRKWEKQVQRTRIHWVATPNSYLCSEHFGKEYFEPKSATGALKLRPGAAPTVFVRPHCPSCSGAGCVKCLPAIQRRGIAAAPKQHTVSFRSERGFKLVPIWSEVFEHSAIISFLLLADGQKRGIVPPDYWSKGRRTWRLCPKRSEAIWEKKQWSAVRWNIHEWTKLLESIFICILT